MSGSEKKRKKESRSEKLKAERIITRLQVESWCKSTGYLLVKSANLPCKCHNPHPDVGVGHSGDPILMCRNCDPLCKDCGEPVGTDYDQEADGPRCYHCST